jgi:hypothetical protein
VLAPSGPSPQRPENDPHSTMKIGTDIPVSLFKCHLEKIANVTPLPNTKVKI